MDAAAVLQLLTDALDPGTVTATAGTTTSVSVAAAVANSQIGNTVTFTGNVTAALAGVTATVIANTGGTASVPAAGTLTFAETLPGTPIVGDTFSVNILFMDDIISKISGSATLGNVRGGDVYNVWRDINTAFIKLAQGVGGATAFESYGNRGNYMTTTVATTMTNARLVEIDLFGKTVNVDEFKTLLAVVDGVEAIVTGNTEDGVLSLKTDVALATAADVVTLHKAEKNSDWNNTGGTAMAGGMPGWNAALSAIIGSVQADVVAYPVLA